METETDPLFRREVTEHVTNRLHGEVLVHPKLSHRLITTLCVIWMLVCGYFITTIEWVERVPIHGVVSSSAGKEVVTAQIFVPFSLAHHIQDDQIYTAPLDGIPKGQLKLRLNSASGEIANVAVREAAEDTYMIRYQAKILDQQLPVGAADLSLAEDTRIHFMLEVGRMTILQLLLQKFRGSERE